MIYSDWDERIKNGQIKHYYMSGIYAHGKLERILGYDLITTDDENLSKFIFRPIRNKIILSLKVQDQTNNIYNVKMYLWKNKITKRYMGLTCLIGDSEANRYARSKWDIMNQHI